MTKINVEENALREFEVLHGQMIGKLNELIKPYLELKSKLDRHFQRMLNLIQRGTVKEINQFLKDALSQELSREYEQIEELIELVGLETMNQKEFNDLNESIINVCIKRTYTFMKEQFDDSHYFYEVQLSDISKRKDGKISICNKKTKKAVVELEFSLDNELDVTLNFNDLEKNDTSEKVKNRINELVFSLKENGFELSVMVYGNDYKKYQGEIIQFDNHEVLSYMDKCLDEKLEVTFLNTKIALITNEALEKVMNRFPNFSYKILKELEIENKIKVVHLKLIIIKII